MANCYLHCGMGLKDRNVHYLNVISTATNNGKTPVFAFGDFNIPAETLRASGLLEALGLDIIVPPTPSTPARPAKARRLIM